MSLVLFSFQMKSESSYYFFKMYYKNFLRYLILSFLPNYYKNNDQIICRTALSLFWWRKQKLNESRNVTKL